jgi:hypothetical protein
MQRCNGNQMCEASEDKPRHRGARHPSKSAQVGGLVIWAKTEPLTKRRATGASGKCQVRTGGFAQPILAVATDAGRTVVIYQW